MKKTYILVFVLAFAALPLFGMGNTSSLAAKSGADRKATGDNNTAKDDKEMITSAEFLKNYDVLIDLDFFEHMSAAGMTKTAEGKNE
jgi:hypothetical protein